MTGRTLAAVLVRVLGILLIVGGLAAAGSLFLFFAPRDVTGAAAMRATAMGALFNVMVSVIAGIYLLRNGDRIAAWLVSDLDEPSDESNQPLTPLIAEGVGVRLLGIYFIISGSRELVRFLADAIASRPEEMAHLNPLTISRGAGGLVELIAGIVLLWKRAQIAGALSRSWRVIRSREDDEV